MIGTLVQDRLARVAAERRIDLEVTNVQPHGLWGISLVGVSARVPRATAGVAVEFDVRRVDITPSLSHLLRGDVVVGRINLEHALVGVVPFDGFRELPKPEPPPATTRIQPKPEPRPAAPGAFRDGVVVEVDELVVHYRTAVNSSAPLKMRRLEVELDPALKPQKLNGYGILPDQVKFAAQGATRDGGFGVRLLADGTTRIDRWIDRELPIHLGVSGLEACFGCNDGSAEITVNDVEVGTSWRPEMRLAAPSALLTRNASTLELSTTEMEFDARSRQEFAARMLEANVVFDMSKATMEGRFKLTDEHAGELSVGWTWDRGVVFDVWAEEFELDSIWQSLQIDYPIEPGILNGSARIQWTRAAGLVELETSARLRGFGIELPRIADGPIVFKQLGLKMHALIDVPGRATSVSRGDVRIGAADPITFRGQLIDAGRGLAFSGDIRAESLDALTFRDGLPDAFVDVADGAILDGRFGFALNVSGHTAFPKDLILDGSLHGDVRVLRDSARADIRSLTSAGPPPQLKRATLKNWRSYQELPPHVPKVLLSAEDAAFFGHPGFDWTGFRNAMAHNLESGSLDRGGSTISQQVVKNLFLDPKRTVARKLQEAYLTWRMESEVSKERILEIYLNLAEWGPGVSGIAQAADHYFKAEAADLTVPEVAMLAAILPSPHRFGRSISNGKLPSSRMHKIGRVLKNLRFLGQITMPYYSKWLAESLKGKIGRLQLEICDDDGSVEAPKC